MDDHLSVSLSTKHVPFSQEEGAQLLVVIDFAIEHNPNRTVFVRERLMAAFEVDDREAAKAQTDIA